MINNIIVVGLGSMGKRRIKLLKKINPNCSITGIDSRIDRCMEAKRLYNIECCKNLSKGITKNTEAVVVCTSPIHHNIIIKEALENNCHVFTEINLVKDGYEDNIKTAKEKKRVLFISSTPMYRKEIKYIKSIVNKAITPINYIYHVGQYLPSWHTWENYKDFFVSKKKTNACREVFAIELPWIIDTFGEINYIHVEKGNITELDVNYPDYYIVIIKHKNGNTGCLNFNIVSQKAVRNLQIYGEDCYLEWGGTPNTLSLYDSSTCNMCNVKLYNEVKNSNYKNNTIIENAYEEELKEFFDAIAIGKKTKYSFEQDKKVLDFIDQIEQE